MRYQISVDGETRSVEIEHAGGNLFDLRVDGGERMRLDVMKTPRTVYSVLIGARQYEGSVDELGDGVFDIHVGASALTCTVVDERRALLARTGAGALTGRQELRAHIPGRIIKVLIKTGDQVELDQPLVVIEAMKMENELRSPIAGTVSSVAVTEGGTVEADALLAVIEPPDV